MNRLTRRTFQIKPPLRGRLAATATEEQKKCYSEPVIRERPIKPLSVSVNRDICSEPETPPKNDKCTQYLITFIFWSLIFWFIYQLF